MARRNVLATATLAALAGAAVGGGATWLLLREPPPGPPPRHAVSVAVPSDRDLLDVAVSADARRIAYTAVHDGRARLYVRRLDRFEADAVPGTEGAAQPFFSPDGETVGFFAEGLLKTVSLADDAPPPATVCRLGGEPAGGAWAPGGDRAPAGTIVFGGPGGSGLQEVPAGGGDPVALTTVDEDAEETAHGWPHVIGPRHVLYTVGRRGRDPRLALLDRETGESRALPLADGGGHFVAPSAVVFARRGEIFAAAVDLEADGRRGSPSPRPVLRGVAGRAVGDRGLGRSRLAAARDGTLVFVPPAAAGGDSRLVRVEPDGRFEALDDVAARHQTPRVAPDGRRVAFSATTAILRRDLWLLDLGRGTRQQLTRDAGDNHSPLWTRDGEALAFASSRTGLQRVFRLRPQNEEVAGPLFGGDLRTPGSWSPDGRRLAFHEVHADRMRDIWTWRRGGEPVPWLATAANERAPAFSPDGRWLAYVSDAETRRRRSGVRAGGRRCRRRGSTSRLAGGRHRAGLGAVRRHPVLPAGARPPAGRDPRRRQRPAGGGRARAPLRRCVPRRPARQPAGVRRRRRRIAIRDAPPRPRGDDPRPRRLAGGRSRAAGPRLAAGPMEPGGRRAVCFE